MRELELSTEDVYAVAGPLDLERPLAALRARPPRSQGAAWPRRSSRPPSPDRRVTRVRSTSSAVIDEGDVLVHHPYESFASSVEAFIDQAVERSRRAGHQADAVPDVRPDSPIVRSLIRAAERGKQVVALVELKARFDEEANIAWAPRLERAGVHVVYGVVGLKTHAKAPSWCGETGDGIRRYCHIGTGNYNSKTARLYEDIGLLTCRPRARRGPHRPVQLPHRLQPPAAVPPPPGRPGHAAHRDRRADSDADARQGPDHHQVQPPDRPRGDRGPLRGVVRRRPDRSHRAELVRGATGDRGHVREHLGALPGRPVSRAFAASITSVTDRWYIGSADLMGRNLDGRIETVVPVIDPRLQARLAESRRRCCSPTTCSPRSCTGRRELAQGSDGSPSRRTGRAAQARGRARRPVIAAEGGELGRELRLEVPITFSPGTARRCRCVGSGRSSSRLAKLRTAHWDTADLRLARLGRLSRVLKRAGLGTATPGDRRRDGRAGRCRAALRRWAPERPSAAGAAPDARVCAARPDRARRPAS